MQPRLNARVSKVPETFGQRLKLARLQRGLTQPQLAKAAGLKQPNISKLERESTLATTGMARLAAALGVSSRWLEFGDVQEPDWAQRPAYDKARRRGEVALVLSDLPAPDYVPVITWELVLKTPLPPRFAVSMPDDSMTPWLRANDHVRFATGLSARAGDVVLVSDGSGGLYVRSYRERRPGHWVAAPLNPSYQELDSNDDDLRVIGVFSGMDRGMHRNEGPSR